MKRKLFTPTPLAAALALLLSVPTWAASEEVAASDNTQSSANKVSDIQVNATKKPRVRTDASGLANLSKSADRLQREQVENVRDLVRYDPGISVTEAAGRGGSRGFSIRGVDRDRVAIQVDGLSAAASFKRRKRVGGSVSESSGARNEVEFENLKRIEIRKGASSADGGSGALGGAVIAQTKDIDDFLSGNDQFGGRWKVGYTSRDNRFSNVIGMAGRHGKFEGFVQHTHRQGHETRGHERLYHGTVQEDYIKVNGRQYTEETRQVSAKDVSGVRRKIPNPLNYHGDSLLAKAGVHFTPEHYAGIVIDSTRHRYAVRDLLSGVWFPVTNAASNNERHFWTENDIQTNAYTPSLFLYDNQSESRVGAEYRYTSASKNFPFDTAKARLIRRNLDVSSEYRRLQCAPFPQINEHCLATPVLADGGKRHDIYKTDVSEKGWLSDATFNKKWRWREVALESTVTLSTSASTYNITDYRNNLFVRTEGNDGNELVTRPKNAATDPSVQIDVATAGPIRERNHSITLNQVAQVTPDLRVSGSLRYDKNTVRNNPSEEQEKKGVIFKRASYSNLAWDLGAKYQLPRGFAVSFRASSGFRNPSVYELIGPDFNQDHVFKQGPLDPEKSFNREVGLEYGNEIFRVAGSYFQTNYGGLINLGAIKRERGEGGDDHIYYNLSKVITRGYDVSAALDFHSLSNKLPEGLEAFVKFGETRQVGAVQIPEKFTDTRTYSLDAIQPKRVVWGVGYQHPDDQWSLRYTITQSNSKKPGEVVGTSDTGSGAYTIKNRSIDKLSRSWRVADVTGHVKIGKNATLRGGIYNLFNYRYITWESLRQTAYGHEARIDETTSSTVLSAPSRNIQVSFEYKF